MSRQARIALSGMLYHVISRGNNRQPVFADESDFTQYLSICRKYKDKYGFKLYHWVLLHNHVHLLMEPLPSGSISKVMQGINLAYTLWFNKKTGSVGHLWQDRFKSILVDRDEYLLECGRYIERNPYAAGMVEQLADYRWSSYTVYATGKSDGITDIHKLYENMGDTPAERQRNYRDYVASSRESEERKIQETMRRGIIGGDRFIKMVKEKEVALRKPRRGRPKINI